jgi:hypothetical protein
MSDTADLVCHDCRIVLYLGAFWNSAPVPRILVSSGPAAEDPIVTGATWKFLAEHVYHRVRLLGESSEDWGDIDSDYIRFGGDPHDLPTVADFLGSWPGYSLAIAPRPLCRAVHDVLAAVEADTHATQWFPGPGELASLGAVKRSVPALDPPGTQVDDEAIARRLASVQSALRMVAEEASRTDSATVQGILGNAARALAPATELTAKELSPGPEGYAPEPLYDAERALHLLKHFCATYGP